MDSPTDLTKSTYEDPDIVAGYIENNAYNPKMYEAIEAFASLVEGENPAVIDLGCGPGQDSYKFAELGFETVGIDYSEQMIENAKKLHTVDNPQSSMLWI
jgi:2-polyprenyl-3-methyl-5-hydroxy-6-metoxy-1,4-benzoquinol methylase